MSLLIISAKVAGRVRFQNLGPGYSEECTFKMCCDFLKPMVFCCDPCFFYVVEVQQQELPHPLLSGVCVHCSELPFTAPSAYCALLCFFPLFLGFLQLPVSHWEQGFL